MKFAIRIAAVLVGIMGVALAQQVSTRPAVTTAGSTATSASAPTTQVGNIATQPVPRSPDRHKELVNNSQANQYDIIFLGDSITHGFDKTLWQEQLAPLKAGNFGSGGDGTQHLLWRITTGGELEGQHPRLFVVMIGVNNMWNRKCSPAQIGEGVELIVKTLREKFPHAKILLLGILPTDEKPGSWLRQSVKDTNVIIARLSDGKSVRFLDFGDQMLQSDGTISKEIMKDFLHPTAKGYEIFLANVKPAIAEMLGQPTSAPVQ